ncbi:hypothetical protein [Variovorax sp. LT1P1]
MKIASPALLSGASASPPAWFSEFESSRRPLRRRLTCVNGWDARLRGF